MMHFIPQIPAAVGQIFGETVKEKGKIRKSKCLEVN